MKRIREKTGSFTSEEHDILDGKAQISRVVERSGDVWQFRMWVTDEKKYIRRSLKTRDFVTAKKRAEDIVFETMSDISTGRKIFGITLGELVQQYLVWRQDDVVTGLITEGRHKTIQSQMKHFLRYKSADLKVSELDRNSYYDYANWRQKTHQGVRRVTIQNEQATINHMMKMGYRNGYTHFDKFDFRALNIKADEKNHRRDTFTLQEYDALVRFMRRYVADKELKNENERLERMLIRDCVLIASNTMLRVGELWALKWGDIESIRVERDENGNEVHLVTINVREETSKVRKSRRVISRGGEYFERLKSRAEYVNDDSFIFCGIGGDKKISRQKWYIHWKNLMDGIGLEYKKRNVTWYSLRHFGITCRVRAKVAVLDIATVAGTSVNHIQNTYGHYDDDMLRSTALKNFTVERDGAIAVRDELTR